MKQDWPWTHVCVVATLSVAVLQGMYLFASSGSRLLAAESQSTVALDEIVVTARKREEVLQDIPVSVSVLSADALQTRGIENSTDLLGRVPGLYFSQANTVGQNPDATFLVIRGVGSNPVLEPSTGLFIDGVYQSSAGFDISFLDLDHVEVLRGPQGTLFGRNTEAGAINLITHKPGPDFEANIFGEAGNYDSYKFKASVSGPVLPDWYGGVSLLYETTSGWLHDVTLDRDQLADRTVAARLALRYAGEGPLKAFLSADFSTTHGGIQGIGVPDTAQDYNTYNSQIKDQDRYNYGVQATLDYTIDPVTITSISGYRRTYTNFFQDIAGVTPPVGDSQTILQHQYTASEELRVTSAPKDSSLSWLAGAYYFREINDTYFTLDIPDATGFDPSNSFYTGTTAFIDAETTRHGFAGFGQLTWRPTELWEATAGIRYSQEDIDFLWANHLDVPELGLIIDYPRAGPEGGPFKDNDTAPLGSLTLHWTKDFMTYATIGKGYKVGGFNRFATDPTGLVPFKSETAVNYEVGTKWTTFGGRLAASADAFWINIKNQQLLAEVPGTAGIPTTTVANAGAARSRGAEFELHARPIPTLTVGGSVSFTDTIFTEYEAPNGTGLLDFSGHRVPFVPRWNGTVNAEYDAPLFNDVALAVFGDYRVISSYMAGAGIASDPAFYISGYSSADFEVALKDSHWKTGVFVRNAFDRYIVTNRTYAFFFTQDSAAIRDTVQPPRTFGVNASYRW